MPIRFTCYQCQAKINAADQFSGKGVRCPRCKAELTVPMGEVEWASLPPSQATATSPPEKTKEAPKQEPKTKRPLTKRRHQAAMRKANRQQLKELQDPDVIEAFPFFMISAIIDDRCCDFCRSRNGKYVRVAGCTFDQIPPFKECTCEDEDNGCRCTIIGVYINEAIQLGLIKG